MNLSLKELKNRLFYNPKTGIFIWLPYFNAKNSNKEAGIIHPNGYKYIHIRPYGQYRAHRLAWFYMTGKWPKNQIDHKNRIKSDNKFSNLREANNSQQQANTKISVKNKLGIRGVCKTSNGKAWRATIWMNGKSKHLGTYKTIKEAEFIYNKNAKKYFGEFLKI